MVEAHERGADGRVKRRHECPDEQEALALAQRWCELGDDDCADISATHRPR